MDAGDYAHPTQTHEDRENWFVLRTMGEMHYDAMTLGELELLRGPSYVKSIIDSTKVPLALANVRWLSLDIARVVTRGDKYVQPDLTRVDEIGFADLHPGSGHGWGGFVNVSRIEVYGTPVKR